MVMQPELVTWMSLPRKDQLALLGLCRTVDFLQITSLQAYKFYQLKSFDSSLSDAQLSTQAGILQGSFTAAQCVTSVLWGCVADASWGGRKFVLLAGLIGTAISCFGVAFARSFHQAVFWRLFGGAINGTVGAVRTIIAENVRDKKYHSCAFLILPIAFNVASLFGPVLGGLLSEPYSSYPAIFGPNSLLGGIAGVEYLERYPYALPAVFNGFLLIICATMVAFGLGETLEACKSRPAFHVLVFKFFTQRIKAMGLPHIAYNSLPSDEIGLPLHTPTNVTEIDELEANKSVVPAALPFRYIWTKNVMYTLLAQAIFEFQMGGFNHLWLLLLSTARYDPNYQPHTTLTRNLPFIFAGGLGMPPLGVGIATSFIGLLGLLLQFTIYPRVNNKLGIIKSYQYFLAIFPIAYALAPYIALVPYSMSATTQTIDAWVWLAILFILLLQVTARTFTLPASITLLNNCSPHPSVLGTMHGIGQSVSSAFRTIGPIASGSWYAYGLALGIVGFPWWILTLISVVGYAAAMFVHDGSALETPLVNTSKTFISRDSHTI